MLYTSPDLVDVTESLEVSSKMTSSHAVLSIQKDWIVFSLVSSVVQEKKHEA